MNNSVIMPCFEQTHYVETALRSVIEQDYPEKAIHLIDRCGTDAIMAIVGSYQSVTDHSVAKHDEAQSVALLKGLDCAPADFLT